MHPVGVWGKGPEQRERYVQRPWGRTQACRLEQRGRQGDGAERRAGPGTDGAGPVGPCGIQRRLSSYPGRWERALEGR